jgi:ribosomal protein S18 acetylase RimI-like enzyme
VTILYAVEPELSAVEFIDLLHRSTLAERRPVDRPDVIEQMLRNADLIVTARAIADAQPTDKPAELRSSSNLVGISRAVTDYSYCVYLSDLAVDAAYQRRGIGRELIRQTHAAAGPHTMLILLAAPKARTYYPHIGMAPHESCWYLPRGRWPEQ